MQAGNKLFVLDAYHGLFEIDLSNGGRATQLVRSCVSFPCTRVYDAVRSGRARLLLRLDHWVLYSCFDLPFYSILRRFH